MQFLLYNILSHLSRLASQKRASGRYHSPCYDIYPPGEEDPGVKSEDEFSDDEGDDDDDDGDDDDDVDGDGVDDGICSKCKQRNFDNEQEFENSLQQNDKGSDKRDYRNIDNR